MCWNCEEITEERDHLNNTIIVALQMLTDHSSIESVVKYLQSVITEEPTVKERHMLFGFIFEDGDSVNFVTVDGVMVKITKNLGVWEYNIITEGKISTGILNDTDLGAEEYIKERIKKITDDSAAAT